MKVYYDIHIHSVLSPCADIGQTPNNILNMCMLKELDMISITDHNSALQHETIEKLKESYDFLILYGIELTIKEGCHIVIYFKELDDLLTFNKVISDDLDKSVKVPYGQEIVCDEFDETLYEVPYFLNQQLSYDFEDIIKLARRYETIIIPAHINRGAMGILHYYNDLSSFDIDGVEIYKGSDIKKVEEDFPSIKKYRYLFNSDAHSIEIISERENYMDLEEKSFDGFKKWLRSER